MAIIFERQNYVPMLLQVYLHILILVPTLSFNLSTCFDCIVKCTYCIIHILKRISFKLLSNIFAILKLFKKLCFGNLKNIHVFLIFFVCVIIFLTLKWCAQRRWLSSVCKIYLNIYQSVYLKPFKRLTYIYKLINDKIISVIIFFYKTIFQ